MDVDRATLVPAGIDRDDPCLARRVGVLVAAQVVVALLAADVRIVALPRRNARRRRGRPRAGCTRCRRPATRPSRASGPRPRTRAVRRVDADVRPVEVLVDVVRTLGQLRHDDARRQRARDGDGRGGREGRGPGTARRARARGPDAADPGAQATATAPTDTTPISASTSRRDRTRPIRRSSSSRSTGSGGRRWHENGHRSGSLGGFDDPQTVVVP